ncbi:putative NcMCP4 [Neospora caninum Liverpool]|uniref:Putative NcMCP4 n=1 Tax=Neospora caninum (strain Liverpool) TaxID=572307 RepID=F0V7Z8_NEOCL|nr:putative NcMCP4 [Neospora caninum Liverpool]CBZ49839.1 putative NcMCP4 [Neospora caninum Liverpool]|eukprot:XP_003879874.1 putative NcMCP4 [Neospora caninum Liverpool]
MVPLLWKRGLVLGASFVLLVFFCGAAGVNGQMQQRRLARPSRGNSINRDNDRAVAGATHDQHGADMGMMAPHSPILHIKTVKSTTTRAPKSERPHKKRVTTPTGAVPQPPAPHEMPVKLTTTSQPEAPNTGAATKDITAASQRAGRYGQLSTKRTSVAQQPAAARHGKTVTTLIPVDSQPAPPHGKSATKATPVDPKKPGVADGKPAKKATAGAPKPEGRDGKAVKKATAGAPKPEVAYGKAVKKATAGAPKPEVAYGKAVKKTTAGLPKRAVPEDKAVKKATVGVPKPEVPDGKAVEKVTVGAPHLAVPDGKAVQKATVGVPEPEAPMGVAVTKEASAVPHAPSLRVQGVEKTTRVAAPAPAPAWSVLTTTSTVATAATTSLGVPRAVSRLQQDLNAFCTAQFQTLCSDTAGGSSYCRVHSAVARFGPGTRDSVLHWRCYEASITNTTVKHVQCMDDCGNHMQCIGTVSAQTVATLPQAALSAFISKRRWIYCTSFQRSADALCNFKQTGTIARYDPVRSRWMCFNAVDISLEGQSYCANNCGGFTPCAGGLSPGEIPTQTVHIIPQPDIDAAFAALHPCQHADETCIPSTVNPPMCVKAHRIVAIQQLSKQQQAMDNYCQTQMDQLCRKGQWTIYCYQLWLSRMVGSQKANGHPEWRCYPFAFLNFSYLSTCTDGCSNSVPCHGAPLTTSVLTAAFPKLAIIAENPAFCSPYQKNANDYCAKRNGEGWVARQDWTTDDWACFQKTKLPTYRWTGCVNQIQSTAAEAFVQADSVLERVIASVPPPCLIGELCTATAMNPPYCSETRPNPQPAPVLDHTIRSVLGYSK